MRGLLKHLGNKSTENPCRINICAKSIFLKICPLFKHFPFLSSPETLKHSTQVSTKHFWMKGIQVCSN